MNIAAILEDRISQALTAVGAPAGAAALVKPSGRPEFGDYQANGCMAAAKAAKQNPREMAAAVVEKLQLDDIAEKVEIAGPGFLNIFLKREFIESQLNGRAADARLGLATPQQQTVVIDYSSPNLAKEMHVGHLRSTIIGDALARIFDFLGHNVVRQNHVGDYGTQFGMLTAMLDERFQPFDSQAMPCGGTATLSEAPEIQDMERFYVAAKKRFDEDPAFAAKSREFVVKLQSGDTFVRQLWAIVVNTSLSHAGEVYARLGVLLTDADVHGESAFEEDLPKVVADLEAQGLLAESAGAKGVYLAEFTNKDNEPAFVIVEKTGGGYLYATTDLAAVRYRVGELHADRILILTDSRQAEHIEKVKVVARKAGYLPEQVSMEHVPFGMMMGKDNRPFKTRTGGTVKLTDLIDEAEQRAFDLVTEKTPDLPEAERKQVAHVVGVGAMKYADLSQNRTSDYVFDFDRMLSLEGNTAPYMQYAYARVRSIFRKGRDEGVEPGTVALGEPAERALGLKLLQFPETLESVADACLPNQLCGYLYELAGLFMGFYENCPVLKAEGETRGSRLALCELTARTIQTGLSLLGIDTVEQM